MCNWSILEHFHHFKRKSHRLCNRASCLLVKSKHSLYILDTGLLLDICNFLSTEILHVIFPTFWEVDTVSFQVMSPRGVQGARAREPCVKV